MISPVALFLLAILFVCAFELVYWFLDHYLIIFVDKLNMAISYWVCVAIVSAAVAGRSALMDMGLHLMVFLFPVFLHLLAADSSPIFRKKTISNASKEVKE